MRTFLNVTNMKKDNILGQHIIQGGEGSRIRNKALREIHLILITYFKQQVQFVCTSLELMCTAYLAHNYGMERIVMAKSSNG